MAYLASEQLDVSWLRQRQKHFLGSIKDSAAKLLHKKKLDDVISLNKIDKIYPLPKTGILIQEDFHPGIMQAVRYLNKDGGFFMRTIKLNPRVVDDWNSARQKFIMRLDFLEIE
jgi:hypothetical protein